MPIYEYECKKCKKTFEYYMNYKEKDIKIHCPNCFKKMKKIISLTSFSLKGSCWEKDGYTKK